MNLHPILQPEVIVAALLILLPMLVAGFAPKRVTAWIDELPRTARLACPVALCVPYALVAHAFGVFRWGWLALYALLPVAIALILNEARSVDTDRRGNWRDYAILAVLGLAVDLRWFEPAWPIGFAAFGKMNKDFSDRDAQILGGSTDSEFVHLAWRQSHPDLKELPFPMLADIKRELCAALGILDPQEGVAQRATFVVDPHNLIRFVAVNDLSVGRNPQEVLRVLDALQTDELCPCNWHKGEDVLKPVV